MSRSGNNDYEVLRNVKTLENSLSYGIFSNFWKKARVVLLHLKHFYGVGEVGPRFPDLPL